jgi:hypothetical protein
MDTTHLHLLLDRIREEQHHQGTLLQDISERHEEGLRLLRGILKLLRDRASKPTKPWQSFLPQGAMTTGIQYAAALAAMIYLLRGGDLEKLAGLVKLFGLP